MGNFWRTDYSLQEFLFIIYTREYQITSKYNIDKIKIKDNDSCTVLNRSLL